MRRLCVLREPQADNILTKYTYVNRHLQVWYEGCSPLPSCTRKIYTSVVLPKSVPFLRVVIAKKRSPTLYPILSQAMPVYIIINCSFKMDFAREFVAYPWRSVLVFERYLFTFWQGHIIFWPVFMFFFQLLPPNAAMVPRIGHDRLLINPFQFTIHHIIRRYMVLDPDSVINNNI